MTKPKCSKPYPSALPTDMAFILLLTSFLRNDPSAKGIAALVEISADLYDNIDVPLLYPYIECYCKQHFIEKRNSRPPLMGVYGIAKIKKQYTKTVQG